MRIYKLGMSYHDLELQRNINEYETFQDESAKNEVIEAIRDHPEYKNWFMKRFKTALLHNTVDAEACASEMKTTVENYSWKFEKHFDDQSAFLEIQKALSKKEAETVKKAHSKITRIVDGEDPEEVFDTKITFHRYKNSM